MTTDEITVSGQQLSLKQKSTIPLEVRSVKELQLSGAQNVPELITKIPGVYVSSIGNGIAKPVIRGMQGMRVLTLVNGQRLESQQWGGDHGLGIGELALGSVEVIKGPASVLYGADALGGVLYLVDQPFALNGQTELTAQQKWNHNTNGSTTSLVMKKSAGNKRGLLAASYANHADFQLPNGKFAQNSRYHEWVLKGTYSWFKPKKVHTLRYAFNNTVTGIVGHSLDSLVNPLSFQVEVQGRKYALPSQFFTNQLLTYELKKFWGQYEMQLLLGQTLNKLVEYEEVVSLPSMQMQLSNSTYQLKFLKKQNRFHYIAGVSGMLQYNFNAPFAEEILIPDAFTIDQGIFTLIKFEISAKQLLQLGARQDFRWISYTNSLGAQQLKAYQSPNLSLGWNYTPNSFFSSRFNISSGFRAPHLSELLADGFHHGALRYEIGNINLVPERSLQVDYSAQLHNEHIELNINPFCAFVANYIYLQPLNQQIEGLPVFAYQQLQSGILSGADISWHYHPHWLHALHWEGNFSALQFTSATDSSISLLPPARLQNELRYDLKSKGLISHVELSLSHVLMAAQNQVAFQEATSVSYQLLHFNARMSLKQQQWVLQTGIRNLTNTSYIDHLSRLKNIAMPGPGRNFYLSIQYTFQHS
jgi:iron complex outermembrane receptor protein